MHQSVKAILGKFMGEFEGRPRSMYLDQKYLVTTGIGFLIAKDTDALKYVWQRISDKKILKPNLNQKDRNEVLNEYHKIRDAKESRAMGGKAFPGWILAMQRGRHMTVVWSKVSQKLMTLELVETELMKHASQKGDSFENSLKTTSEEYFKDFDQFPADAQLGILCVAWANGADYLHKKHRGGGKLGFPNFCESCRQRNWGAIARAKPPEYHWKDMSRKRDSALNKLFMNAEEVESAKKRGKAIDFSKLYWPNDFFEKGDWDLRTSVLTERAA